MNISIPYSWLKDYIKTDAKPEAIAEALSLHSFSVEKITDVDDDNIFEIEVTPNRGDALSILGVARELMVVLPRQGFKCEWVKENAPKFETKENKDTIEVSISDKTLVPRFSAVVMDNVKYGQSPKIVRSRLEKVGIRPLGNVIDVTNYMMVDRGQPMHVFDYDKILGHKMIVRESSEGEVIQTLDGVERKLPAGVIVIEDGDGRLIDLCGIMGAKNSEVDENTKKILLFVQVYDPVKIRKASMSLGHRTDAALRFEKGIDYDGVIPALCESVSMVEKLSGATVSSELIDIVNFERPEKLIKIDVGRINKISGVNIDENKIFSILDSLGFEKKDEDLIKIPSWRYEDIDIAEDIAEEVIRIYGYHELPEVSLSGEIPLKKKDNSFYWEKVIKYFLKYNGFFECYTYSATSVKNVDESALKIQNPLSEDMSHLKTSLIPQLLEVVEKNSGFSEVIKVFEIASVYKNSFNDVNKIPDQPIKIGIVTKGVDYKDLRGILSSLVQNIGLPYEKSEEILSASPIMERGDDVLSVEIDFYSLIENATKDRVYTPITNFNFIKEDLTFEVPAGVLYPQIKKIIMDSDERIDKLEFKDIYNNYLTFSIEYLDNKKQISSEDTQEIRKKIFKNLEKIGVTLKV